jgi:hypothetical protein
VPAVKKALRQRPTPPEFEDSAFTQFRSAPEIGAWVNQHILAEDGALYNDEHKHLLHADMEFLWASQGFPRQGREVLGQAELVAFRTGGWQKARQEQQFAQWFGRVPDFLITLDAEFCATCSDTEWCALVEHELYHIGQARDDFGNPAFTKDGIPKLAMRGHDVEEFVGVVRRYGVGNTGGALSRLVRAANTRPEVAEARISMACGTCLRLVA